jgi:hypothetical protein
VVDIELGILPHLPGWVIELTPDTLLDVQPGETRNVSLSVRPPVKAPLPPIGSAIVDVEAYAEGELVGGFRKSYRSLERGIYLPLVMNDTE